ncbi:MAG: isoprenylcysteine carboxylmethyltransferase family protein [Bacteroidales bacterium]|nr:isoprenylcysteine carboxylmethyltransferase family protein [Bacteroidales bacterium]
MRKLFSLIVGIIIFSGLPLLGWGIYDFTGFIQNPYRLAYICMMAVLSVLVVIFVPNEGRGEGEGVSLVKKHKFSLLFLQIVPTLVILFSPLFDRRSIAVLCNGNNIRAIGLIITFLGYMMMNWSVLVLGRQFSVDVTLQENHKLITRGPYKYIRHPRYLGIITFFGGIPLIFNTWIPLTLILLTIIVLRWRISDEEKMMKQEFTLDWDSYKKRSWRLIPFLY